MNLKYKAMNSIQVIRVLCSTINLYQFGVTQLLSTMYVYCILYINACKWHIFNIFFWFNAFQLFYVCPVFLYIKAPIKIMCLPVFVCLHQLLTRVLFVIFLLLTLFYDVICYVSEVFFMTNLKKGSRSKLLFNRTFNLAI